MEIYPLKFVPILHEKIWGGEKLKTLLNKKTDQNSVGESWEISSINGFVSTVANGVYQGENLPHMIDCHKEHLVGKKIYQTFKNTFPLLIKFIDAKENLSIQVHPDNALAKSRHDSFGKNEMWYVIDAEKNATLNIGFSEMKSKSEYKDSLAKKNILEKLHFIPVIKKDAFFIKEGLVHSIGKGCLIAEIQQISDITYRLYDWDRTDKNGRKRDLHTELALDALNFDIPKGEKIQYEKPTNTISLITKCDFFSVDYLKVEHRFDRDLSNYEFFVIYICVDGKGAITVDGKRESLQKGDTVLIPAITKKIVLEHELELLEVKVPEN